MIQATQLRIGNKISGLNMVQTVKGIAPHNPNQQGYEHLITVKENGNQYKPFEIDGIALTPEILEKCGFKQLPHFTVQNLWNLSIGRDRIISVACVGTPNEMVFINEEQPPVVKNIIVARNYDYDGRTHLHQLQNLYFALTGTELSITI